MRAQAPTTEDAAPPGAFTEMIGVAAGGGVGRFAVEARGCRRRRREHMTQARTRRGSRSPDRLRLGVGSLRRRDPARGARWIVACIGPLTRRRPPAGGGARGPRLRANEVLGEQGCRQSYAICRMTGPTRPCSVLDTTGSRARAEGVAEAEGAVLGATIARERGKEGLDLPKPSAHIEKRAGLLALLAAVLLLATAVAPAVAYTVEVNNFPNTPVGCDNQYHDGVFYPCIRWPYLNGYSSSQYVYLDASLGQETRVNLYTDATDAFGRWNAPSNTKNPYLYRTTDPTKSSGYQYGNGGTIIFYAMGLPSGVYASTTVVYPTTSPYYIWFFQTQISQDVIWNHSFDYSRDTTRDPDYPYIYHADSRKVMTHEIGHGEGLGHTYHTAIMQQGAVNFYTLTSDDIAGLGVAYP